MPTSDPQKLRRRADHLAGEAERLAHRDPVLSAHLMRRAVHESNAATAAELAVDRADARAHASRLGVPRPAWRRDRMEARP